MYVLTILWRIYSSIPWVYCIYLIANYVFHTVERINIEQLILGLSSLMYMHLRLNEYTIGPQTTLWTIYYHKSMLWAPPISSGGLLPYMEWGGSFEILAARRATLLTCKEKPGVAWRLLNSLQTFYVLTSSVSRHALGARQANPGKEVDWRSQSRHPTAGLHIRIRTRYVSMYIYKLDI